MIAVMHDFPSRCRRLRHRLILWLAGRDQVAINIKVNGGEMLVGDGHVLLSKTEVGHLTFFGGGSLYCPGGLTVNGNMTFDCSEYAQ